MSANQRDPSEGGDPRLLVTAVQELANCPCATHQEQFTHALRDAGALSFEIARTNLAASDREVTRTVRAHDVVEVPVGERDGQRFFLTLPRRDGVHRAGPGAIMCDMSVTEACQMLLRTDLDGIVIQAGTDDEAWAVLTRQAAAAVLA